MKVTVWLDNKRVEAECSELCVTVNHKAAAPQTFSIVVDELEDPRPRLAFSLFGEEDEQHLNRGTFGAFRDALEHEWGVKYESS